MEILEQLTFLQPDMKTRITLRRLATPFFPPFSCERLVNGRIQQGIYGASHLTVREEMRDYLQFEEKIGSHLL